VYRNLSEIRKVARAPQPRNLWLHVKGAQARRLSRTHTHTWCAYSVAIVIQRKPAPQTPRQVMLDIGHL